MRVERFAASILAAWMVRLACGVMVLGRCSAASISQSARLIDSASSSLLVSLTYVPTINFELAHQFPNLHLPDR